MPLTAKVRGDAPPGSLSPWATDGSCLDLSSCAVLISRLHVKIILCINELTLEALPFSHQFFTESKALSGFLFIP